MYIARVHCEYIARVCYCRGGIDQSPGPSMSANEGVLIRCNSRVICEGSESVLEGMLWMTHLVLACLLTREY